MRTDGLRYMKHNIAFVLVLVLSLVASPTAVRANQLVKITPGKTEFVMETKPSLDEYTKADNVITISWHKQVKGDEDESLSDIAESWGKPQRTTVTYYAREMVCHANNREISPSHIEACVETNRGYNSGYQSLENRIPFLRAEDEWAQITFRLAPEAWGPAGTYEGWLESPELGVSGDIRIKAKIDEYIGLSVDKTSIEIDADHGPGSYLAVEPVTAQVVANHKNWTLKVTSDPLKYVSGSDSDQELSRIEPSNVFVKLEGDPDDKWKDLESGMVLCGSSDFEMREYKFIIKVKTELQHTAGTYSGGLRFTISK